jgi:hypothetical protein
MPAVHGPSRRDDVIEVMHGESIVDRYRWLENGESPETQAWTARTLAPPPTWPACKPGPAFEPGWTGSLPSAA